jgi:hypothetical protein
VTQAPATRPAVRPPIRPPGGGCSVSSALSLSTSIDGFKSLTVTLCRLPTNSTVESPPFTKPPRSEKASSRLAGFQENSFAKETWNVFRTARFDRLHGGHALEPLMPFVLHATFRAVMIAAYAAEHPDPEPADASMPSSRRGGVPSKQHFEGPGQSC